MRLFVGVELDPALAASAGSLVDELRLRARELSPAARITWVTLDRFHLTVRFIGSAAEAAVGDIRAALDPVIDVAPFDVRLSGTGAFPRASKPQVLWCGLREGLESLQQVEREVTRRLTALGIPPEDRPYQPHLTLGRVREAAGLQAGPLLAGVEQADLGASHVGAITLFESRLSPKGPTYLPLQRTLLRG